MSEANMPKPARDLEAEVLSLLLGDRALLLERLIASVGPKPLTRHTSLEAALRRQADAKAGRVAMIPGDEALARVRARIA